MFSLQLWLSCPLHRAVFLFCLKSTITLRWQRRFKNRHFSILSGHPGNGQSRATVPKLWFVSWAVREVPLLQAAFKTCLSSVLQTKSKSLVWRWKQVNFPSQGDSGFPLMILRSCLHTTLSQAANLSTDTSQALSEITCQSRVLSLQKEASRLLGRPEVPSPCKWWFPCWAAALNWEKCRWQGASGHITFKLAFSSCSSLTLMAAWLFCRSNFKFRCSTSSFLLTKSSLIFSNCSFKSKTFQWNKWR